MEAVTILRELWRRRILVGVVALISLLVGLGLAYTIALPPESRSYEIGIATGRILVDTPDSQVVDVSPKGSETLGIRASLIANLMTEGEVKAAIAERAGLEPRQLKAGVEVDDELPPVLSSAAGKPNANLLITSPALNPDGLPLPIVNIETRAPDAAAAGRLEIAAVDGLGDYLESKAAGEQVPNARRLEVTGLGAPQIREEVSGPSPLVALLVAIFIFVSGCTAIVVISSLARSWRAAAAADEETDGTEERPVRERHRSEWLRRARTAGDLATERLQAGRTAVQGRWSAARSRWNDRGERGETGVVAPPPRQPQSRELWIPGRDEGRSEVNGRKIELVTSDGRPVRSNGRPETSNGRLETSNGRLETSNGRADTSNGQLETSNGHHETTNGQPQPRTPSDGELSPSGRRRRSRANGA